jgi:hypothetical protein
MKPPYKTGNNVWLTQALFWEKTITFSANDRLEGCPVFSLYDDKKDCINCRKTFIEMGDPTGYKWAQEYLGDYEHWLRLMKCKWFQEAYDVWMNELKMKLRSEALDTIRTISNAGQPAQALVAAKYLASFEWEKAGRGRPSKQELQGEIKRAAKLLEVEDEDALRIGLKVVK